MKGVSGAGVPLLVLGRFRFRLFFFQDDTCDWL